MINNVARIQLNETIAVDTITGHIPVKISKNTKTLSNFLNTLYETQRSCCCFFSISIDLLSTERFIYISVGQRTAEKADPVQSTFI